MSAASLLVVRTFQVFQRFLIISDGKCIAAWDIALVSYSYILYWQNQLGKLLQGAAAAARGMDLSGGLTCYILSVSFSCQHETCRISHP